jgi:hypothetical protein
LPAGTNQSQIYFSSPKRDLETTGTVCALILGIEQGRAPFQLAGFPFDEARFANLID